MNRRIVAGLLGYLTLACGAAMIPPFILAAAEDEFDGASSIRNYESYLLYSKDSERIARVVEYADHGTIEFTAN